MSRKKIIFKPKTNEKDLQKQIDDWVLSEHLQNDPSLEKNHTKNEELTRFTIVIPELLHRKIKKKCIDESISMKDRIISILEENFKGD